MSLHPERPVSLTVEAIVGNVQEIVRSEVRLAKTEMQEKAQQAARAGSMLGVGAVFALYGVGFLLLAAVWALALAVSAWLAALMVGAAAAIVGGTALAIGKQRLKALDPKPDKTVRTLKENVLWMKQRGK